MRVKGVPLEMLLSLVTQASVFAAEHCRVRTAIIRAWQIRELRALSCGHTIERRMPGGACSSNVVVLRIGSFQLCVCWVMLCHWDG